jgi:hypothetical protein
MCKNKRTLNTVGIVVALSLIGGTGVSTLFLIQCMPRIRQC